MGIRVQNLPKAKGGTVPDSAPAIKSLCLQPETPAKSPAKYSLKLSAKPDPISDQDSVSHIA
jgi:hypothetical protein